MRIDQQPIGRSPTKSVYATVLQQIFDGTLAPGTRLPTESDLAEHYRVSRATVRKALTRLKDDQLVVSRQGDGNYVAGLSHSGEHTLEIGHETDFEHILEIRREIEGLAAAQAALSKDSGRIAELKRLNAQFGREIELGIPDRVSIRRIDFQFHHEISRFGTNPILRSLNDILAPAVGQFWLNWMQLSKHQQLMLATSSFREHQIILTAIESGDVAIAETAMRQHFMTLAQRFKKVFREPYRASGELTVPRLNGQAAAHGQSAFQTTYDALLGGIIEGKLQPGARLSTEEKLACAHGVSRSTIRKVLQALKDDYFVQSRQGDGNYIMGLPRGEKQTLKVPSSSEFSHVFEIRQLLESVACSHAAQDAQKETISYLKYTQEQMWNVAESRPVELLFGRGVDISFHKTIAECGRNPILKGLIGFLIPSVSPNFSKWSGLREDKKALLAETTYQDHAFIIQAIEAGNPALARMTMHRHFELTTKKYKAFVWLND